MLTLSPPLMAANVEKVIFTWRWEIELYTLEQWLSISVCMRITWELAKVRNTGFRVPASDILFLEDYAFLESLQMTQMEASHGAH